MSPKRRGAGYGAGYNQDKPGYEAGRSFYFEGRGGKTEGLKFGRSS